MKWAFYHIGRLAQKGESDELPREELRVTPSEGDTLRVELEGFNMVRWFWNTGGEWVPMGPDTDLSKILRAKPLEHSKPYGNTK